MGVTKRTTHWLFCDYCVTQSPETAEGMRRVRELAKLVGWERFNGLDLCPRCKEASSILRVKEAA